MEKERIDELIQKLMEYELSIKTIPENLRRNYNKDLSFFDRIYEFSNEDLYGYFSKFNLNNGKILTVGSSGDQILYSILCGAKDITHFDINPYSKFYFDLKVASIKSFEYDEFNNYYKHSSASSDKILTHSLYNKISHLLPEDSKYFWDNIFIELENISEFMQPSFIVDNHYSFNKEQYDSIKEKLNDEVKINFINTDLRRILPYIKNQKFDAIFLSNIFDYIHEWKFDYANIFSKDLMYYTPQQIEFFNICNDLMGLLNPSGKLQVHYVLGGNIQQNYQKISIENLFNFLAKHNEKFEISTIELSNGGPIIIENSEKEISGN